MKIRPVKLEDSVSLAQVQIESYRTAYAQFFPPAYLARFTYDEQTQDWRDLIAAGKDILLVAETDAGAIYHDEQNDEWLVDVASKGITMYFDREEFQEFMELLKRAVDYTWELKIEPRRSA